MNTARIFVVSAQDIFRAGMVSVAHSELALDVVGDASKLAPAIGSIQVSAPDLVILDLHECDLTRDLTQLSRPEQPFAPKSIVITAAFTDYELAQCVQSRVNGIVCRNAARSEMITAIRKVLSGRVHYCSHTNAKLRKDRSSNALTKRELEVLHSWPSGSQIKRSQRDWL